MRRLPTLRGLQAFDAVARSGSLAGAARALSITPSAVSHRLRGLEQELGLDLLARTPGGLRLTEAGRRYRADVEDAFASLSRATEQLLGSDLSRPLTVTLTSEIGMRWLMPRFHRFMERHPEVETAILSTYRVADLVAGEADIALRHGAGQWPGLRAEPILRFSVSPLCAPRVAEALRGLPLRDALARSTLIRDVADGNDDWDAWLRAAGAGSVAPARLLRFEDYSMAVRAAIGGHGLLLGYSFYVEAELAAGSLVRPFDLVLPTERGYHLVYLDSRLSDPRVSAFRDWVMTESRETEVGWTEGTRSGTTA